MVTIKKSEVLEAQLKNVIVEDGEVYMDASKLDLNALVVSNFEEGKELIIKITTKSIEELN